MKKLIILGCFGLFQTAVFAQTIDPSTLQGLWRMKMDINADGGMRGEGNDDPLTSCLLKMTAKPDGAFDGEFTQCGFDKYITGNLYNGSLINAVMYGNAGDKYVYSGRVQPNGDLAGTYFTPSCLYGDFVWEKVVEDNPPVAATAAAKPMKAAMYGINTNTPSMTAEYNTATPKVLCMLPYNPAIPMYKPETIPADALYMGQIVCASCDSIAKAAKVAATPWEEQAPSIVSVDDAPETVAKYSMMTTPARSKMAQPIAESPKKILDNCDRGTTDHKAARPVAVNHGKKVVEDGITYHIVGTGETMFCISHHYNITIEDLAAWNDKPCEHLRSGEKLRVSAPIQ